MFTAYIQLSHHSIKINHTIKAKIDPLSFDIEKAIEITNNEQQN